MIKDKILDREALARRLEQLRAQNPALKVVFTNGCFDLMHVGHLRYLWEASKLGDVLVVAINDDDSVRRLKGPERPILKQDERLAVLAGLECVDLVTWYHEDTPVALLEQLRPDALVKGANYTSIDQVVGHEIVAQWGAQVLTVELTQGRSTSALIDTVLAMKRNAKMA